MQRITHNTDAHQPRPGVGGRAPRCRGVAMIMVMVALAAATIITLTFLSGQTTSMAIAHNATRQTQARAIAEDGLALAMEYLRADTEWRDSQSHGAWTAATDLNGGTFRVMFEDEDDSDLGDDVSEAFIVTVEGSYNGVTHRVSNRVVPTGTSSAFTVMLVTGNAFHADEDLERIAVIESWGYTVLTVTDSDSQALYDAAAAQADVVYVSEESASGSVGTKLNGYTIGVVNEEQALQDELKMSSSGGNWTGSTIEITDNTHPITSGFALGDLQITTNSTGLIQSGGTPAAGLTTLAERIGSSTRVLTAIDIGDTLTDGSASPQRRVTLPFGSNSFEYGQLNDDGQKLMKQAIDWASGGSGGGPSVEPDMWYAMGDLSGATAVDAVGSNDGVYVESPSLNQTGYNGTAVGFDDGLDRVTVPVDVIDGLDDYSFSVWIQTERTGSQALFSGARSSNNNAQLLFLNNSSNLRLYYGNSSGSHTQWTIPSVADGEWHHVVVVRDGTQGQATAYLDGAAIGTNSVTMSSVDVDHLVLAEEQDSVNGGYASNQAFVGTMDDVMFFQRTLTATEVLELYENVSESAEGPGLVVEYDFVEPDPVTPELVSHWKLDETSANNTFVEVDGEVAFEAENYSSITPGTGSGASKTWNTTTANSPSGGTALIAEPNTGTNMGLTTDGPRLDYQITFTTPGTYRVWVRMIGTSGVNDSMHVGLDGVCLTNARGYGLSRRSSSWVWIDDVASGQSNISLDIPAAGTYTFNIWMREDGAQIDKIVLNTDANQPSGAGPAASEAGGIVFDDIDVSSGGFVSEPTPGVVGFGDSGTAVEFDGNDQFVEVPHEPAYLMDQGAVAFWFYANDNAGTQGLISKDATGYVNGGHLNIYTQGTRVEARLQSDSASYEIQSSGNAFQKNSWHHVVVGFGSGGFRLYVNGVLEDSDSYTGGLGTTSGGTGNQEPWTFGVGQTSSSSGSTSGWDDPFHGRLDDIRLYDTNLDTDQVGDLMAQTDPRAVVPAIVKDTSGSSLPLDLSIADPDHVTWISGGGLTIDSATSITSSGGASTLYDALTDTDEITVEAVFTPANITQDGPARIVTYSNGTGNRNFHLGQTDASYNARLRTEFNSSGTPEAESGDVLVAGSQEHVILTYDNENQELRLYRNGNLEVTEAWTGDLDNWSSTYDLLLANEVGGSRPWLGTLHRIAIYDGAVNTVQADNLFNGDPPGDGTGGEEGLAYETEWLEKP